MNNHYLYFRFESLICVYTIWFDLTSLDFTSLDLTWLILCLFIRNGSESHLSLLHLILPNITLSYLVYLKLIIISYDVICVLICDVTHSAVDWLRIFIIIIQWPHWYQNGLIALYCAANGGHLEVVSLLLDSGANIEATNNVSK